MMDRLTNHISGSVSTIYLALSSQNIQLACVACESDNAHDFRDFANHLFRQITFEELDTERTPAPLRSARVTVPHVRDVTVVQPAPSTYLKLVRKGGGGHG